MKQLEKNEVIQLLESTADGVLAFSNGQKPYCLPFGFVFLHDSIFISMFPRGRKWDAIEENPNVCFNVYGWNKQRTAWSSVVVDGRLIPVEELSEIESVVRANIEKKDLDPVLDFEKRMKYYAQTADNPNGVKLFKIEIENMEGRRSKTH